MGSAREVALVTGGARGIGVAICRRLADAGHPVVVNYSSSAVGAAELTAEINGTGGSAVAIRADVSDPAAVRGMFEQATERLGAPTILINNAGVSTLRSAVKMAPHDWDRVIAVNLNGAFYCTHTALPAMYDRGWGRVVFFGSPGGGRTVSAGMAAYGAAKAGLVALTKVIALETARRGITVNTVVPGYVETDMVRASGAEVVGRMDETWPKVSPEAVAALIGFLVSPEAEHVSGEDIAVWRGGPSPILGARPA